MKVLDYDDVSKCPTYEIGDEIIYNGQTFKCTSGVQEVPPTLIKYDSRGLEEPFKTMGRLKNVLSDARFTFGERVAIATLILEFQNNADTKIVSVKRVLSDSNGFSSKIRDGLISKMQKYGLVFGRWRRGIGTEITLLF